MKINEIREFTDTELRERELAERDNLTKMRLSHAITPLDNPQSIKEARRTIARMQTEARMRQLKQQQPK
ncbi:50S ribosomal protein L29 [Porphyromonadaceae bacterium COT-184 OH4590]|nr:50S ribosomal protein L29 [Porphyromonadaceae bacterium COT-184 OH4590]MDO4726258.1 50S ribosomal protein L29 [Porphyromonadaceae bacterium]